MCHLFLLTLLNYRQLSKILAIFFFCPSSPLVSSWTHKVSADPPTGVSTSVTLTCLLKSRSTLSVLRFESSRHIHPLPHVHLLFSPPPQPAVTKFYQLCLLGAVSQFLVWPSSSSHPPPTIRLVSLFKQLQASTTTLHNPNPN